MGTFLLKSYCHDLFRFSLECETYYTPDGGHQENIFNLSDSEKRDRVVDLIDIVKDNVRIAYIFTNGSMGLSKNPALFNIYI